jgi:hypothetical protein
MLLNAAMAAHQKKEVTVPERLGKLSAFTNDRKWSAQCPTKAAR